MGKGQANQTNQNLQKTESNLLNTYSGIAIPAAQNAGSYWNSLLNGGPAAQAATAPYAQTIAAQTAANQSQIQNTLPAGGQQQLALATNRTNAGASVANLYQGLGPTAATQLQSMFGTAAGAGTGSAAVSANAGATNINAKNSMFGGIGSGVGSILGSGLASKGTGAGLLGGKNAGGGGGGGGSQGGFGNVS